MGQKHSKYSVLIAIDFGTTYSGYAYSFRRNKEEILCNPNWGAELGGQFWKTPTSIMYNSDGRTDDSFGFKGEEEYFRIIEDGVYNADERPSIFKCFKMQLYGEEKSSHFRKMGNKMTLKSDDGTEKLALDVFGDALSYMKDHALQHVQQSEGTEPKPESILWVVTVPAIWKDRQKIFMREACLKAGLIGQLNSRNLLIALEPECASMYCRHLSWEKFVGLEREKKPRLKSGTTYMTVDLGGGTVDITVHKVASDGKVEEVIPPLGGPYGGNLVNESFTELLARWLGEEFINYVKTQRPSIWLRVMQQFEMAKRAFEDDKVIRLQMYLGFAKCYEEYHDKKIENVSEMEGVRVSANSDFVIPYETMRTLFDDVVDGITNKMFEALNKAKEKKDCAVKYIFLVGGFSDCKFVQKAVRHIETTYRPQPIVLIPNEASLCVLKGAVVYGHNPECIKSRMSALTYAMLSERPYKQNKDDQNRMERVDGKLIVRYLDAIIKKGEGVPEGTMRIRKVKMPKSIRSIEKQIYISENKTVDNPSSSSAKPLGKLQVTLLPSTTTKNRDRDIELQFIFGSTELEVRAAENSGATVSICEYEEVGDNMDGTASGITFQNKEQEHCSVM